MLASRGPEEAGEAERCAYKLLLVALLICSSRADDADEDHHPIMMACDVEVGVGSLCRLVVVWLVRRPAVRGEQGMGVGSNRSEGVASGSNGYRAFR